MTAVPCALCGSERGRPMFRARDWRFDLPGEFHVVRCEGCTLARTEPQPADLSAYYPSAEYYSYAAPSVGRVTLEAIRQAYERPRAQEWHVRVAGALARPRLGGLPPSAPGDVLDVGCGSGATLLALEDAGWRPHGVEIDPGAVERAHEAGLADVHAGELMDVGFREQSFDVVRFWHSLEHTRDPRRQLVEARRLIRPGGMLVIGVPDFQSLLRRLFGNRWFYLDVPRHLWHFDRRTLARLVADCGFTVERVRNVTTGSALLGTIDGLLGGGEKLPRNQFLLYAVQPLVTLIDLVGLGDEIELVARAA